MNMNTNNIRIHSLLWIRIWILFITFLTANTDMNIICKEYLQIYSNIRYSQVQEFLGLCFFFQTISPPCLGPLKMKSSLYTPSRQFSAKGCFQKSLNGRLHAKEWFLRGLQIGVCGDNIHWRKHQLNGFSF